MPASTAASDVRTPPSAPSARGAVRRALVRPELAAAFAAVAVFVYFALAAGDAGFLSQTSYQNTLEAAATVGIIAAPITLLLVAGEFDLSVGAMVGASQILFAYPLVEHGWPLWAAALLACGVGAVIGLINGVLVVKAGVPSFIITLGSFFWIRGTAQGLTTATVETTTIPGVREHAGDGPLLSSLGGSIDGYSVAIVWFVVVVALAAWVLSRTATGNRIYAIGGNLEAARRAGVASNKMKIGLYVTSAVAASLVGILLTFQINQGDVNAGIGLEFETFAAAAIGGAALTGGIGSPIGTAIGAILFGMVSQGFFFTNIPDQWYQTFLGVILVVAVMVNTHVHRLMVRVRTRS